MFDLIFFLNSVLMGVGLSMDAFSVSVANGIAEPDLKRSKSVLIASTYAFFQAAMPLLGYLLVRTLVAAFNSFEKFIPFIALILLCFLGGKMCFESVQDKKAEAKKGERLTFNLLILQGIATSIDALSGGFTISEYNVVAAIVCALIISVVTFSLCLPALFIGKKLGEKFTEKATFIGGVVLILIGIEIFVKGIFF